MLSPNLEKTLHRALGYANERRHDFATLEHLLLALTEDPDAIAVMRACNLDIERLRRDLVDYIDSQLALIERSIAQALLRRRLDDRPITQELRGFAGAYQRAKTILAAPVRPGDESSNPSQVSEVEAYLSGADC